MERAQPAAGTDAPASSGWRWCRVCIRFTMVAPSPGQLVVVDRGPRTLRISVCAPPAVLIAIALALASTHPWTAALVAWIRERFFQ